MIKIKKEKNKEFNYALEINGKLEESITLSLKKENRYEIFFDEIGCNVLTFQNLLDLPIDKAYIDYREPIPDFFAVSEKDKEIFFLKRSIQFPKLKKNPQDLYKSMFDGKIVFSIDLNKLKESKIISIPFTSLDRNDTWTQKFSFRTYSFNLKNEFIKLYAEKFQLTVSLLPDSPNISFLVNDFNQKISEALENCFNLINEAHLNVIQELQSKNDAITISFNEFPINVRVYCEQYLQYFAEFLRDLGVSATSDLKHETGKVLFTVKSDDKKVSLEKIRIALDVYLDLPKSPSIDLDYQGNEIRIIKYIQEVNTLKSRLATAEMQIQYEKQISLEKDKQVQLLGYILQNFDPDVLKNSIIDTVKESNETKIEEKKKLLKGTIEIGKLKIRDGVNFDIPKFLENTKLDAIFDQLEEWLNQETIVQLKLNE